MARCFRLHAALRAASELYRRRWPLRIILLLLLLRFPSLLPEAQLFLLALLPDACSTILVAPFEAEVQRPMYRRRKPGLPNSRNVSVPLQDLPSVCEEWGHPDIRFLRSGCGKRPLIAAKVPHPRSPIIYQESVSRHHARLGMLAVHLYI